MRNRDFDIPEIKLSYKQKLILDILKDEFHGQCFGPQILDESDNEEIHKLSINEITYAFKMLGLSNLVSKEKKIYKGRLLNLYSITPVVQYDAIIIK